MGVNKHLTDFLCDFWEREHCYLSGVEQEDTQAGASASVLTPEASTGAEEG